MITSQEQSLLVIGYLYCNQS